MLTDNLLQGALIVIEHAASFSRNSFLLNVFAIQRQKYHINRILAFWSFTYQTLKTGNVDSLDRISVLYVGFPRLVLAAESGEWGDTAQM